MARITRLNFPKPRNCLGLIDLHTAAEVITIFTLINKVSGFYGILSLFTGAQISTLQMAMYLWSIGATGICLWALKAIRDEKAVKLVWFAYFNAVDFLINVLFTLIFAWIWTYIVSDMEHAPPIGSETFDSVKAAADFLDPVHADVTKVHVIATPAPNPLKGTHAELVGEIGSMTSALSTEGSMLSTVSICMFWLVRLYFIWIIFGYARSLVIKSGITATTFSLGSDIRSKAQRWMLSGSFWREDEYDYKQTNRLMVSGS